MDRRDFLIAAAMAGGAAASQGLLGSVASAQTAEGQEPGAGRPAMPVTAATATTRPREEKRGEMIYRALGKTGEMVSVLGLGGAHIGGVKEERDAIQLIRSAIDKGIVFMDNCWDYHNGKSEQWMGNALRDGYRGKVFLMSKIDGRTRKSVTQQIDESLKRLQTDHVDLMQFHEVIRLSDPDVIFGEQGAWEAMEEARKAGKVRFVGFTGHKDPSIHLRMLEAVKENGAQLDTVQMPLNVMDAHFRSFEKNVLPVLVREQIGVLGMKSMGSGEILKSGVVKPVECLHYAMSLPTSVVITGIDSTKILDQAMEVVRTFKPMSQEEVAGLLNRTAQAASKGKYELFKTSYHFDGTAQNPQWLGTS